MGIARREVGGGGVAGDVGSAGTVYPDGLAGVHVCAAKIGCIDERGAAAVHLGHVAVVAAPVPPVEGLRSDGEIGGVGDADHIRLAERVHCHAAGILAIAPPQVGGVDQAVACGGKDRHERIPRAAREGALGRAGADREVRRPCAANDVGVAGRIGGHGTALLTALAAQVGAVEK